MSSRPSGSNQVGQAYVETVHRFFELLNRKDTETWGQLWHEEGTIMVPYPPEGFPTRIHGKTEIVSGFRSLFDNFESFESELTGIYPAADSAAVCVEYRNHATLAGGTVYTNQNIAVFRFQDELISEYHDYFDPRLFQIVVDALAGA
jgi:ketosteroid isomerase-like protein